MLRLGVRGLGAEPAPREDCTLPGRTVNPPLLPLRHVEHLGAQAHRGNVVCKQSGFSPISASAADKLPRGRRGQRNGLVYHPEYDGFAPDSWQVVINAHESARLELAGAVDGAPSTIVDIQRAPATTEARLLEITEFAIDQHAMVRQSDGVGGMVGIGDRLGYDGEVHSFVMKEEQLRGKFAHDLHFATEQFTAHFAGLNVGWEEMLKEQAELWPDPKPKSARCWDASVDLGNSCHTDRDGARSFAVWLRAKPDGCACGWWFLFPEHGVAVALAHGTWISWDGRSQPHCSAVPCVPEGDRLLSLFASLPANLCSVFKREQACGHDIAMRHAQGKEGAHCDVSGSERVLRQLKVGTPVMLRWVPEAPACLETSRSGKRRWGASHFRWLRCKVVAVEKATRTVTVRESASPYWVHPPLSASQVYNGLVVGHY